MSKTIVYISILLIVYSVKVSATDYFVLLTSNDPVVQGAEITFTAKLFTTDGNIPEGKFEYIWEDNALEAHFRKIQSSSPEDSWSVSYPADVYPVGPFKMQVIVNKCYAWSIFCIQITSKRLEFNITSKLNGHMNLIQNNQARTNKYIAAKTLVTHEISLNPPDAIYLKNNATSIQTYWFVDCVYYGMTPNYTFIYKYDTPNSEHVIEGLVVADFEPITTPAPPTTTTVKPNTTTTASTTTPPNQPNSTTTTRPNITTTVLPTATPNQANSTTTTTISPVVVGKENTNSTITPPIQFPFVCMNKGNHSVLPEPRKVYGYFSRKMVIKAPINNITVTGNNWLQHGDLLQLQVKCTGSPPFLYCLNYYSHPHNATQNETCYEENSVDDCDFPIQHYYNEAQEYTIVIVIKNEVTKLVSPVTVTVYKAERKPQLSVIVVPVSFSLVAVVLIVFGIAYYIQNRRRFTVEVANFDFGQQYSDLEYKTFRERLRDSISNAFTKAPKPEGSEPTIWPPSRKYGSMT